jgi:hypothetical protein
MTSTIHLEFDVANTRYRLVDTTDYISTGINPVTAQMKGLGTIRFNGSIDQQHNTVGDPLVNIELGATTSPWYDLPTDTNGEIVNGTWTVTDYSVRVVGSGVQFTSITLPYTIVTEGSNWVYDFLTSGNSILLTGGTPQTVVIASIADGTPNATITTTTVIASATHDDISFDVTNLTGSLTHTYSGCVKKTPNLDLSYDCDSGAAGTFTAVDSTSLGTTAVVSRTMVITPPASAPLISPVTTTQSSYTVIQLATLTWSVSLSLSLSHTQTDGAVINYTVSTVEESKVSCVGSLCGINDCLENLRKIHALALKTGASPYQIVVDNVLLYWVKAKGYKECGKMDEYRAQIALLEFALGDIDCGCGEDEDVARYIVNGNSSTQTIITQLQSDLQYKLKNGIPTVNDDITTGVQVGAIKQDANTGIEYRCTSNAIGAATWVVYYDPSPVIQIIPYSIKSGVPTVADDSSLGYLVGYVVQNYLTGIEYRCENNSVGAAVWKLSKPICIDILFSQLGTAAPDLIVNGNITTATITATYSNVGDYNIVASAPIFVEDFTHVIFGATYDGIGIFGFTWINATTLNVFTRVASTGVLQNGLSAGGSAVKIEIFG